MIRVFSLSFASSKHTIRRRVSGSSGSSAGEVFAVMFMGLVVMKSLYHRSNEKQAKTP
jgi:hypothetical protein